MFLTEEKINKYLKISSYEVGSGKHIPVVYIGEPIIGRLDEFHGMGGYDTAQDAQLVALKMRDQLVALMRCVLSEERQ